MKDKDFPIINLNGAGIYTISGLKNLIFLRRFVSEKKISLIVMYHESSDFYGLALSIICNIPVISSRRDMSFKTKSHHRLAYRLGGRYFDSVITVSNAVKQEVVKRGWFPEERICTIYNAINTADYGNANDGIALRGDLEFVQNLLSWEWLRTYGMLKDIPISFKLPPSSIDPIRTPNF